MIESTHFEFDAMTLDVYVVLSLHPDRRAANNLSPKRSL
jgi:hypothetical protein